MKTELTDENYEALARYRQERAHETIAEIPYLRERGYYNTATNRLYYACYYAAVALLTKYHTFRGKDYARYAFRVERINLKGEWQGIL